MSASTASSTTTTAASPFATGRPAASRSTRSSTVSPPGDRAFSRGVTARSSVRDAGGTGRSRLPLANAGRAGTFAEAPAGVSSRGAWPTRSTWTCTLGVKPSSTGISSVCEPPAIVKRSSRRSPLRRRVRIPSAGAKGASTRTFATSPARYSFRSGTSVTFSSSRPRRGGTRPPATQTRSSVSFSRPRSSATRATTRQAPPSFASKRARTGSPADSSVRSCASFGTSFHSPSTCSQSSRSARKSTARPAIARPSRSVAIASITMGSPFCTKARSVRRPT